MAGAGLLLSLLLSGAGEAGDETARKTAYADRALAASAYPQAIEALEWLDKRAKGTNVAVRLKLGERIPWRRKVRARRQAGRLGAAERDRRPPAGPGLARLRHGPRRHLVVREEPQPAEAAFRAAIAADPAYGAAHYRLAQVLFAASRNDDGLKSLQDAVDVLPAGHALATASHRVLDKPRLAGRNLLPAFTATTLDGGTFSSSALDGKVVVLDFWATWCGPCVKALPTVKRLARAHAADDMVLISVSVDGDVKKARKFAAKNGMDWPQLWEHGEQGHLARAFAIEAIPTYVFIDRDGVIVSKFTGPDDETALRSQLDRLLALLLKREPVQ